MILGSTVIPTIGRPTLSRAVYSVLDQSSAGDWELIVVNDSGQPLPESDWQRSALVQVAETNRAERSVARNMGAAIAQGRYLHFLDDDDWLLPGGLARLRDLGSSGNGAWLYGGSRLVNSAGDPLVELHHDLSGNCFVHVMAGEWIPLQASLIRADVFRDSGGFNPLLYAGEDADLCRRILLRHDVHGIPDVVVCICTFGESSSTDYRRLPELSRWARELILGRCFHTHAALSEFKLLAGAHRPHLLDLNAVESPAQKAPDGIEQVWCWGAEYGVSRTAYPGGRFLARCPARLPKRDLCTGVSRGCFKRSAHRRVSYLTPEVIRR